MKPTGCQRKLEDCQSKSQGLAAECNFCFAGLLVLGVFPSNRSKRVFPRGVRSRQYFPGGPSPVVVLPWLVNVRTEL